MNAKPRAARVVFLCAGIVALLAAGPPKPVDSGLTTHDFRIETDATQSNINTGDFLMPHHVRFIRPGTDVVGDSAKGNYKNGTVTITGHVVLHDNGQSNEARSAGAPAGGGPSTLQCDQLAVDSKRKIYVATGNVKFDQGDYHATADNGRLDQGAHALDLQGSVHLANGPETMDTGVLHYNTLTRDMTTSDSTVLSQPAPPAPAAPPPKSAPKSSPKP